jgi:hypothetical protein
VLSIFAEKEKVSGKNKKETYKVGSQICIGLGAYDVNHGFHVRG